MTHKKAHKIDVQYQPAWMVVRVQKTAQTASSEATDVVLDAEPVSGASLLTNDFLKRFGAHSFDPIRNEDDWIMWRMRNVEDQAERLWDE